MKTEHRELVTNKGDRVIFLRAYAETCTALVIDARGLMRCLPYRELRYTRNLRAVA